MSNLFDVDGSNLDLGFEKLKAAELPTEQQLRTLLQQMWAPGTATCPSVRR